MVQSLQSTLPLIGVLATLVLVGGGASNSSFISSGINKSEYHTALLASYLFPIVGGVTAWLVSFLKIGQTTQHDLEESSRRTLVIETLSKSPTLAYVLAKKHFGQMSAAIPAFGMVSLAIVGAAFATLWSSIDSMDKYQQCELNVDS